MSRRRVQRELRDVLVAELAAAQILAEARREDVLWRLRHGVPVTAVTTPVRPRLVIHRGGETS